MPDSKPVGQSGRRLKWALIWTWDAWDRRYDPYVRRVAWRKWRAFFRAIGVTIKGRKS